MPLLPPEPLGYPEDLFGGREGGPRRWWVFQTRPRAEKAFARLLRRGGTAYFLPQYTHTWRKSGRTFKAHLPLFPGYIFACGDRPARDAAFATHLVTREVPVPDQVRLDRELGAVHHLLGGGGSVRPEEGIARGARVLVVEGTYAGVEGRVVESVGSEELRVCVEVTLLGRGVSVVVDRWAVKVLDTLVGAGAAAG